jgi:NAD/NADP transhydrogenase beta subunit
MGLASWAYGFVVRNLFYMLTTVYVGGSFTVLAYLSSHYHHPACEPRS